MRTFLEFLEEQYINEAKANKDGSYIGNVSKNLFIGIKVKGFNADNLFRRPLNDGGMLSDDERCMSRFDEVEREFKKKPGVEEAIISVSDSKIATQVRAWVKENKPSEFICNSWKHGYQAHGDSLTIYYRK